jgi:NAD(P)-dependent dehydrogenase (short-subunit alcohol dehydrogenase family)
VQCDVANTEAAAEMVKQVKDAFGRIDFLVNNAGITRDNLILRMKEDDWDEVLNTNLKGAWNFAKAALRTMLRQDTAVRFSTSRRSAAKSAWRDSQTIRRRRPAWLV